MRATAIAAILTFLLPFASAAPAADEDSAAEMKRLAGRFERSFTNAAGTVFRVVQDISGDQSIVTTYDDVGNIVEAHQATFKVEKRGPVRVFSFFNLLVTAGPDKGHTQLETNSYIYRVDDRSYTEVWGLLDGDPNPPQMLVWRRVKDDKR
jgi:hypothetical protein